LVCPVTRGQFRVVDRLSRTHLSPPLVVVNEQEQSSTKAKIGSRPDQPAQKVPAGDQGSEGDGVSAEETTI
jgi:hypothetical protein